MNITEQNDITNNNTGIDLRLETLLKVLKIKNIKTDQTNMDVSVISGNIVGSGKTIEVSIHLRPSDEKSHISYTTKELKNGGVERESYYFTTKKNDWVIRVIEEIERTSVRVYRNLAG